MEAFVLTEDMRNEWLAEYPHLPLPNDGNEKLCELWNERMFIWWAKPLGEWIMILLRNPHAWQNHPDKDEFVLSLCDKGWFFSNHISERFLLDLHQVMPDFYSEHKNVVDSLLNDMCKEFSEKAKEWQDSLPHLPLPSLDQMSLFKLWTEDERARVNLSSRDWLTRLLRHPLDWRDYAYRDEFLIEFCQQGYSSLKKNRFVFELLEIPTLFPEFYARHANVVDYAIDCLKMLASPDGFVETLNEASRGQTISKESEQVAVNMFGLIVCDYYVGQPITDIVQIRPKFKNTRLSYDFRKCLSKKFTEACKAIRAENARRDKIAENEWLKQALFKVVAFWQKHGEVEPKKDWKQFVHSELKEQLEFLTKLSGRGRKLDEELAKALGAIDPDLRTAQLSEMIAYCCKVEERKQRLAAKMRAEEEARQERLEKLFEKSKHNLEERCRYIVNVFNALMNLDVDDDAVINSGVIVSIGSVHSSIDIDLDFRQTFLQKFDFHTLDGDRTWLELESGNIETDFRDTVESANLLVWHELCHLADPRAVKQFMSSVILPKVEDDDTAKRQALEVIIDGLGMNMGMSFYVHPDPGEPIPRRDTERRTKMYESHAAMGRRIVAYLGEKELSTSECVFVTRFIAELDVHSANGSKEAKKALRKILGTFGEKLGAYQALREAYAALYIKVLFWQGIASLKFHSSLSEMDEDEAEFIGESATIH